MLEKNPLAAYLDKSLNAFGHLSCELFELDPLWGLLPVIEPDLTSRVG